MNRAEGTSGTLSSGSTYTLYKSQKEKRENEGDIIWRNNGWKPPKFEEQQEDKYPRNSVNSKWDKSKEIHTKTYYNQTCKVKDNKSISKAGRGKQLVTHKESSIR